MESDFSEPTIEMCVNALLECDCMRTPGGRDMVVRRLPDVISAGIDRRNNARDDVENICRRCLQYPDGKEKLLDAVRMSEKGTLAFSRLERLWKGSPGETKMEKTVRRSGEKTRVFISYAREDLSEAKKLYERLKAIPGVIPWLDEEDLLPGQNWKIEIRRVIRLSRFFISLLSSRAVDKRGFFQKEQRIGMETLDEFPENEVFLIPVRIDDCRIPYGLEDIAWVDLFPDYEKGFEKIVRSIRADARPD